MTAAGAATLERLRARRTQRDGKVVAAVLCAALAALYGVPFLGWLPKDELVRTSVWGLALLCAFAGWGSLVARACWPTQRVSLPLSAVWGASAMVCAGGVLASVDMISRPLLLLSVAGGHLVLGWTWSRPVARVILVHELRARFRAMRAHPPLAAIVTFVAIAIAVLYLGGASDVSSNPFDDDISYYPFAKQLLERGTLLDPFSFRRMSTLGGQALFHAMLLARIGVEHLNVFDRGVCLLLVVGLLATHRIRGAKVPTLVRIVSVLFFVCLPNTSINTASFVSGVVFFLALVQTLDAMPDTLSTDVRAAVRRTLPLALVSAATCTLRQNYQVTVALVVLLSYGFALSRVRRPFRARLVEPIVALVLTALLVAPWLVLLYRSNLTFLFPVVRGTFRAGLRMQAEGMTVGKVARFCVKIWFSTEPISTIPLLAFVGLSLREASSRRVLVSAWVAGLVSVVFLAWGFSLSNVVDLARYDHGFLAAASFSTWHVTATGVRWRESSSLRALLLAGVALFGLLACLEGNAARTLTMFDGRLRDLDEMMRRTVPPQREPPIAGAYRRIQEAVPAGARLLVMVDQPFYLDFGRNEVWNLDMPGASSPPPSLPCFSGPEPLAAYFAGLGIRYVAYVESEHSTFQYRRSVWLDHAYDPEEIWRIYAPYFVDVIDNLAALGASRKHLHDEAGMVVLDLERAP